VSEQLVWATVGDLARLGAVRDAARTLAGLLSIHGDGDGERARFTEGEPAERVAAVRALWDALDG
jgi:hypothetical protein